MCKENDKEKKGGKYDQIFPDTHNLQSRMLWMQGRVAAMKDNPHFEQRFLIP
jgi:hypothetical protein